MTIQYMVTMVMNPAIYREELTCYREMATYHFVIRNTVIGHVIIVT